MAEKGFGVKEVNLIGASGTPTITSPNNLNLNANNVAISTNVSVGGTLSVTGNVSVGGTLTYEDVTNIDSIGIITARDHVIVGGGLSVVGISTLSNIVKIMSGLDLQTNGTLDIIGSTSSSGLDIQSNASVQIGQNGFPNRDYATFTDTGVNLNYSGSTKLATTNTGVNVTGAITVNGSALSITPTDSDIQVAYTVTANGSSAYRFAGNGVVSTADNPDLYLIRGQKYRFINNSGGSHPFQIRESSGGTAYSTGVTNNGASSGNIDFAPTFDSPAQLVYQCTSHGGMVGNIYLRDAAGNNTNVGVVTATAFIPAQGQLSHRNLIINGDMTVAQHGQSSTASGHGSVDRFAVYHSTDDAPTQSQSDVGLSDLPFTEQGLTKCLKVTNGNQSGAGNAEYVEINYKNEAQDIRNSGWNYQSSSSFITLTYYARSSVGQTFTAWITNRDGTRKNFVWSYALSANTWTKITKVIPGDSGLTINNDNGAAFELWFQMFYGTNYSQASPPGNNTGSWVNHDNQTVEDNDTSWYLTNNATFEITGVQLEVGSVATPFEHLSFSDNLRRCQRYYYQVGGQTNDGGTDEPYGVLLPMAMNASATRVKGVLTHPVPMRTGPSVSGGGSGACLCQTGDTSSSTVLVFQSIWTASNTPRHTWVDMSPNSGTVGLIGETGVVYANNSTYHFKVSAEL